jgi:hypothetical protein
LEFAGITNAGNEDRISIITVKKWWKLKLRLGMLHLAKDSQYNYIGFLDADLSTNFDDFHNW